MPKYKVTAKALDDLRSIGRYTSLKWGAAQRNRYLGMLDKCFDVISKEPALGMVCDEIKSGY